ncbi:MAG: hypothetical protein ACE5IZ_00230 [Dehalococcoidia bacterium]
MIIRILGEGQYRLAGSHLDYLNEVDNEIVKAVEMEDEDSFRELLTRMLDYVRQKSEPLPLEELAESDLILPNDDITVAEARAIFSGEGAVPG